MNLRTVGCAVAILVAGAVAALSQVETALTPQVDHHQHLLSPTLVPALSNVLPPPAIELPTELRRRFLVAGEPRVASLSTSVVRRRLCVVAAAT